ncbi:LysR family transcriptional regulator [Citreimonas salinaria]|uniref:Transcriptional regulator, LysR family n=1 Tax=Citreimonas salinaria TaxID=321339 RepID=A0A1H3LCJ4_9RHOB|nr:LysR family transcriptional regulator [Citreimonas salinaria]SDY61658.1 transcriptional regulator, LysR family [Citreimonas salinaria]
MPLLIDIKAFLVTARKGGFSAAAREIGTAPSVITKRVSRLEHEVGKPLFERSTRKLLLTPEGERLRPQLQILVAELEETISEFRSPGRDMTGNLRIKSPTTIGTMFVGRAVSDFLEKHRDVTVEILLMDRLINPLEEGLDIALGALPQSFASVEEFALCPYPRLLVASPAYLEAKGRPETPADILAHDCLAFVPVGLSWTFSSKSGPVAVDIRARFTVNDSRLLVDAAVGGHGLTVVPEFLAREELASGALEPLLPDFPIEPYWFKAMVPQHKLNRPEVLAMVEHLKTAFDPPPWER